MKQVSKILHLVPLACLLLLSACDSGYRTFSLVLDPIDYSGSSRLFIALNDRPEIFGSFLSYGVTVEQGQTVARIDDILWESHDEQYGEDVAWLLVAEDTDGDGTLNEGDQLIPAMRIQLPRELDEIVISGLRFESGSNTVPLLYPDERTFPLSIFMSEPERVTPATPIYLFCDANEAMDLAIPPLTARTATFIFDTAELTKLMIVRINQPASPHALAWWDANGNARLDTGDWVSSNSTIAQNMDSDKSTLVLSPLLVEP